MKVTYLERIERRIAWNRKMYCGNCGDHEYEIVKQLEPVTDTPWTIRCPYCEYTTKPTHSRDMAISGWKAEC